MLSRPCRVSTDSRNALAPVFRITRKSADAILMKFRFYGNFINICQKFEIFNRRGTQVTYVFPEDLKRP